MAKATKHLQSGMYLLTAREGNRDYGCLINSVMEVSRNPERIAVCLVKSNMTHEILTQTGIFNLCTITENAPYDLFRRFGMTSSRKTEKFADFSHIGRSENGLAFLTQNANMYLSAKVYQTVDLGDHTLFIGEITGEAVLAELPTCTYDYFLRHICPGAKP